MLLAGASIGLLCAAVAIVEPWTLRDASLSPLVAARVNDFTIPVETYNRAVGRVAADSKDPIDADRRRWVLERLIEEELLVQRGLALEIPENDKAVRGTIVREMIASITAQAEAVPLDDAELRRFYSQNGALFAHSARLRLSAERFQTVTQAEEARKRLTAVQVSPVSAKVAEAAVPPIVPDALLPLPKLREYLGPTVTDAAASLAPGEISSPIRSGDGFVIVRLIDKKPDQIPVFENIRDEVAAAYRKHQGDTALRDYLERLKRRASIQRNANLR